MITGGDGHVLILNDFLESFDTCLSLFVFMVEISEMSSGFKGRSPNCS